MGLLIGDEAKRKAWLDERKKYVTSTDVPVLFGQGYSGSSPIKLWSLKKGLVKEDEPTTRMRLGRAFQDGILAEAALSLGMKVEAVDPYLLHKSESRPWLATSLDGIAEDGRIVEAKLHGHYVTELEHLPHGWLYQVQAQLMVTEAPGAVLAVCEQGVDLKLFDVLPDEELQSEIALHSSAFFDYLKCDQPPPPSFPGDNAGITALYRYLGDASKPAVTLDGSYLELLQQRKKLISQKKQLSDELDLIEANIKYAMGAAETAVVDDVDGVRVTWKMTKGDRPYRQMRVYGIKDEEVW